MAKKKEKPIIVEEDAVHCWFELSYSSYMVLPWTMLQSMNCEWQKKFIELVNEMDNKLGHHNKVYSYTVLARDKNHKLMFDDLRNYERGRRKLEIKEI